MYCCDEVVLELHEHVCLRGIDEANGRGHLVAGRCVQVEIDAVDLNHGLDVVNPLVAIRKQLPGDLYVPAARFRSDCREYRPGRRRQSVPGIPPECVGQTCA